MSHTSHYSLRSDLIDGEVCSLVRLAGGRVNYFRPEVVNLKKKIIDDVPQY
jgi:hypothetical protein